MKIKGTISPKYGHSGCKDFDIEIEIPNNKVVLEILNRLEGQSKLFESMLNHLKYIGKEAESQTVILQRIEKLLTPTNLTVSQEYIDEEVKKLTYTKQNENDSGKNDLDKIRDALNIHIGKRGGRS